MKLDSVEYTTSSKGEPLITLRFIDYDHSMPQMDNQVHREMHITIEEWKELKKKVDLVVGVV